MITVGIHKKVYQLSIMNRIFLNKMPIFEIKIEIISSNNFIYCKYVDKWGSGSLAYSVDNAKIGL